MPCLTGLENESLKQAQDSVRLNSVATLFSFFPLLLADDSSVYERVHHFCVSALAFFVFAGSEVQEKYWTGHRLRPVMDESMLANTEWRRKKKNKKKMLIKRRRDGKRQEGSGH